MLQLADKCSVQVALFGGLFIASCCYYLYTNNVKVYELSTSNYLYLHIVLSIFFRV